MPRFSNETSGGTHTIGEGVPEFLMGMLGKQGQVQKHGNSPYDLDLPSEIQPDKATSDVYQDYEFIEKARKATGNNDEVMKSLVANKSTINPLTEDEKKSMLNNPSELKLGAGRLMYGEDGSPSVINPKDESTTANSYLRSKLKTPLGQALADYIEQTASPVKELSKEAKIKYESVINLLNAAKTNDPEKIKFTLEIAKATLGEKDPGRIAVESKIKELQQSQSAQYLKFMQGVDRIHADPDAKISPITAQNARKAPQVLQQWFKTDPQAALAYVKEHQAVKGGGSWQATQYDIWKRENPKGTMTDYIKLRGGGQIDYEALARLNSKTPTP